MNQQELKKIISYNHITGEIKRLDRKNGNGSKDAYGYLIIKIKGTQYKAHRLAWLYMYGSMPDNVIDHINGNKLDNSIINLRDVSQKVNSKNRLGTINPETGVVGVYIDKTKGLTRKKYATSIDGRTKRFYSIEEAIKARLQNNLKV
tara:strand:- start:352 stop:792 length:441 start_codon:yes stop_codon:yes gene_type:complete